MNIMPDVVDPSFAGVVPLPSDVEYRCCSALDIASEGVDVVCASCHCESAHAPMCISLHYGARVCVLDHVCFVRT